MSIRHIVQWPNKGLAASTQPIDPAEISKLWVQNLAEDLIDTCDAVGGLGLAANQIGENFRIAVLNLDHLLAPVEGEENPGYLVMINPDVIMAEGDQILEEGCLSIPQEQHMTRRPAMVSVQYTDLSGEEHTIGGQGLLAVALLHEVDHLDGIVYCDHLPGFKRSLIRKRQMRLKKKLRKAGFDRIPVMSRDETILEEMKSTDPT